MASIGENEKKSSAFTPKPATVSVTAALGHMRNGLEDETAQPGAAALTMVMGASGDLSEPGLSAEDLESGGRRRVMRRLFGLLRWMGLVGGSASSEALSEARLLRRRAAQRRIVTCGGACSEG